MTKVDSVKTVLMVGELAKRQAPTSRELYWYQQVCQLGAHFPDIFGDFPYWTSTLPAGQMYKIGTPVIYANTGLKYICIQDHVPKPNGGMDPDDGSTLWTPCWPREGNEESV